jgi:hypothetical protein
MDSYFCKARNALDNIWLELLKIQGVFSTRMDRRSTQSNSKSSPQELAAPEWLCLWRLASTVQPASIEESRSGLLTDKWF